MATLVPIKRETTIKEPQNTTPVQPIESMKGNTELDEIIRALASITQETKKTKNRLIETPTNSVSKPHKGRTLVKIRKPVKVQSQSR